MMLSQSGFSNSALCICTVSLDNCEGSVHTSLLTKGINKACHIIIFLNVEKHYGKVIVDIAMLCF